MRCLLSLALVAALTPAAVAQGPTLSRAGSGQSLAGTSSPGPSLSAAGAQGPSLSRAGSGPSAGPDGCGSRNSLATPERVPQRPFGADFASVCNRHDQCYATLGASRAKCDSQFRSGLRAACQPLGGLKQHACLVTAEAYAATVRVGGQTAFATAQAQAKQAQGTCQLSSVSRCVPSGNSGSMPGANGHAASRGTNRCTAALAKLGGGHNSSRGPAGGGKGRPSGGGSKGGNGGGKSGTRGGAGGKGGNGKR